MNYFGALIEKIQKTGFAPLAPSEKSKPTYTLHTVVRDQLGMADRSQVSASSGRKSDIKDLQVHITSDMADVSYWDYRELRVFLTTVHSLMDEEVSLLIGNRTNATAWAHDSFRQQSEIVELFKSLSFKYPELQVPKTAQKRLSARAMVQNGRVEAAIANTLAVLVANGSSFGDLLEGCSQLNLNNETLLDHLDSQVKTAKANRKEIDKESLIPRQLVVTYVKKRADMANADLGSPTVCQYLESLNKEDSFAANADEVILARLSANNVLKN